MALKIELEVNEVNTILAALGRQPFDTVAPLVYKIKNDAEAQIEASKVTIKVDPEDLQPNNQSSTMTFVFSLPGYGQDTIEGGAAQFIQGIADYNIINGTITVNSPVVTNVGAFPGVHTGISISAANIPSGTTVSSFSTGAGTITASNSIQSVNANFNDPNSPGFWLNANTGSARFGGIINIGNVLVVGNNANIGNNLRIGNYLFVGNKANQKVNKHFC